MRKVKSVRYELPEVGGKKLHYYLNRHFDLPFHVGRDRLYSLLKDYDMLIDTKRKYAKTTDSQHRFKCYINLIKEKVFKLPRRVLVSDITYIRHFDDFYYLALITDYVTREIVGYHLSDNLTAKGPIIALKKALTTIDDTENVIHHSDRGVQYCCHDYINILSENKMKVSMTEEDHVYENALAERVNGILKNEFLINELNLNLNEARLVIDEVIYLYNNKRIHESLNYRTPVESFQTLNTLEPPTKILFEKKKLHTRSLIS